MTVITIPQILRERLTEAGADALVQIINVAEDRSHDRTIEVVEERFERRLAEEIGKLEIRLIRWMFAFWIGQVGILTGLFFTFFRRS